MPCTSMKNPHSIIAALAALSFAGAAPAGPPRHRRRPRVILNGRAKSTLALAFLIAGCAATPTVQQVRPIEGDLSRYGVLQVIVDAQPESIRKQNGYVNTSADLQKEFIANVSASGKFATVGAEVPAGKGLEARLTITEFSYVSGAARGLVGVGGGQAILNVTMTLKDRETGTVVGILTARHASSDLEGAFSAVTSRQLSAIALELASRVSGR